MYFFLFFGTIRLSCKFYFIIYQVSHRATQFSFLVLLFASYSSAQKTESSNTSCENESTCSKCTITGQCKWFLDQQTCVSKTSVKDSSLIVDSDKKCPQFSVSTTHVYEDDCIYLHYTVKVLNDSVGFMKYLNKNNITCSSTTADVYDRELKNNEIVCSTKIKEPYFEQYSNKSLTVFINVKFNGVILRLDNIADHYATMYKRSCVEEEKDKYCATCTWNDDGFAHYVRLCSSRNTCEGRNEVYMRHSGNGEFWNFTSQKVKDRCAEINVTSVAPLSGSLAAKTNINITVKNHGIFADNRTVNITVAGMVCKDLRTTGNDTITCTVIPPPDDTYDEPPSGPVLIKYISNKGELNVESSQTFQFDIGTTCGKLRPVLDLRQVIHGVERGGTTVKLNGFRFIKPCVATPARMFVKLPNGTMHFASKNCDTPVNDKYIVCRAPEMNRANGWDVNAPNFTRALNFGLELMNFVGNNSLLVNGTLISYYHVLEDYVLEEFEIAACGSVTIYGNHLRVIHPDVLIRFKNQPAHDCKVVYTTERSFVCTPNASVIVSAVMNVTIGDFLTYKLKKRPYDLSYLIWFFIVTFLTVIVLVSAYCYRIHNRHDVHKTDNAPPVNLEDLNTRTALLQS